MIESLEFLPAGGLASSVITTVWIGVMVVVFFNLRFGTTLSGLVVPGYLVPLFLVNPVSAWVILVESVVTYFGARLLIEHLLTRIGLSEMFGRDRFFMLILFSVLVRVISDGYVLPELSEMLTFYGAPLELRSGLHSFGLIIIALCANQFWNGGFKIGASSLALYLVCTFLIIRFILIPFTNFNISTLGYMYEDIATSILASPKAYIILITSAFVASRMNLKYGWDFNGILIPSLLALQWYNPEKILTTFIEAFVIYFGAQLVMKAPYIRQMNLEGARQMFVFFNVGFVYKIIIGYAIIWFIPQQKVTDFYGFGYLLGTLIALKMYQKGIAIRITRTTLQTSFFSIVIASFIGFSFTLFAIDSEDDYQVFSASQSIEQSELGLNTFIAKLRSESYLSESEQQTPPLSPQQVDVFTRLFKALAQVKSVNQDSVSVLSQLVIAVDYQLTVIEERYVILSDKIPKRGHGIFILDTQAKSQLHVQIPRALEEVAAAGIADIFFNSLDARYMSISAARAARSKEGADNVLLNPQSLLHLFFSQIGLNNTLQVRAYKQESIRKIFGIRNQPGLITLQAPKNTLWVKRSLPKDLSLNKLEQLVGELETHWQAPPDMQNRQRDVSYQGFSEIFINAKGIANTYIHSVRKNKIEAISAYQRIDGYLQAYLHENKLKIAEKGSNAYQPASQYELLYFAEAFLAPVLSIINNASNQNEQQILEQISHYSEAATTFGYETIVYKHLTTGDQYLILKESEQLKNKKYWGTFVLKIGNASHYIIEVPRPINEQQSYEFGAMLFERLQARALIISGSHPFANTDGSSILTARMNKHSMFNLFHQVLLKTYRNDYPVAVQIRGFSDINESNQKAYLTYYKNRKVNIDQHIELTELKEAVGLLGFEVDASTGQAPFSPRAAKNNAQSRYTRYVPESQYAEIWLPTMLRKQMKRNTQDSNIGKQLLAYGIETRSMDVQTWLFEQTFNYKQASDLGFIQHQLKRYLQSNHIVEIAQILQRHPANSLTAVLDQNTQHLFLVSMTEGNINWIANLNGLVANENNDTEISLNQNQDELKNEHMITKNMSDEQRRQFIRAFVERRALLLSSRLSE
jgi:gamma-polyglutamate biosynthesis protein CapC